MRRQIEFKPMVPESLVRCYVRSQAFYCGLLGFERLCGREDPAFAYLKFDRAQLMIEPMERDSWLTVDMISPFGRGTNLQIEVCDIAGPLTRLEKAGWPLFLRSEEVWYRAGDRLFGQHQFLVQDIDGYLLRFCCELGDRAPGDTPVDGRIVL